MVVLAETLTMKTLISPSTQDEIVYPESDGEPMGETELHYRVTADLVDMLDGWFATDPMVHVAGDLMLYYVEGDSDKQVSPDIQVTIGVSKLPLRNVFLVWN